MSNFNRAVNLLRYAELPGRTLHPRQVEAIVTALQAAGLLAPDLPEPDAVKLDGDIKYFAARGIQVRQNAESDHVQVYTKANLTTTEARSLALALLAAADYAEKEQDNE